MIQWFYDSNTPPSTSSQILTSTPLKPAYPWNIFKKAAHRSGIISLNKPTAPPQCTGLLHQGRTGTQPGWVKPVHGSIHNPSVIFHTACKYIPSTHPSSPLQLWGFKGQCHFCILAEREGHSLCTPTPSTGRRGSVTSAIVTTEEGKAGQALKALPPSSPLTQQGVYMELGDREWVTCLEGTPAAPSHCLRGKYTTI